MDPKLGEEIVVSNCRLFAETNELCEILNFLGKSLIIKNFLVMITKLSHFDEIALHAINDSVLL